MGVEEGARKLNEALKLQALVGCGLQNDHQQQRKEAHYRLWSGEQR